MAAVLAFVALAATFAFQTPPFLAPDETAHLGYAREIADFHLPTIEGAPDIPDRATQWQAEADSREDDRYRDVWVANHPPLNYVAVAPLMWVADVTGRPDGGLMFLRLANIAFAAVGIVFTYLLALEITGGARRVALAAAALAAFLPQGLGVYSAALNDGLGFAAAAAVLWAGTRCVRRGATTGNLVLLAAAGVVAWGARASTMLLSVAVVAFVAVLAMLRRGAPLARLRRGAIVGLVGIVPGAAAFGWYYARNIALYGDIGASSLLLERFRRTQQGSLLEVMTWGHRWVDLYHKLLSPSPLFSVKPPAVNNALTILAVVGLIIAVVLGRTGDRARRRVRWRVSRLGVLLGVLSTLLVATTVAQHMSGGGSAYARYLFPAVPMLATFAAVGLDRLVPRLLPAAVVGAMGWWAWINVPTSVDLDALRRPRDGNRGMPDALRMLPSSAWSRNVLVGTAVVATAGLAIIILTGLVERRPRRA